ncbi:MAG TPA: DinB family protein [Chitinophagaceae bacterium]|nr:DinB family protein [Chitinophagaceae bacterium]
MARPVASDYAPFYETYVKLVQDDDLIKAMQASLIEIHDELESIPAGKFDWAYAEGKWTVRALLQHMIDAERVFAYRAMAFARGEKQELPGFDENEYARVANVTARNISEMKEELLTLRRSVYFMYKGFTEQDLTRSGVANKNAVTVNALGYIMIGHVRHHFNVIKERYL